jgi:hypothetical protein
VARYTSYCRLLVFLKVVVDEPEDERRLHKQPSQFECDVSRGGRRGTDLADGRFTEEDQLDAAARFGCV